MGESESGNDLIENNIFHAILMKPFVLGAIKQLERVRAAQDVQDIPVCIYELSSLLEHLDMIRCIRRNAGLLNMKYEQKIRDFRIEVRHTLRLDNNKQDNKYHQINTKRASRLGKNEHFIFMLEFIDGGVKIGDTELLFDEMQEYIDNVQKYIKENIKKNIV